MSKITSIIFAFLFTPYAIANSPFGTFASVKGDVTVMTDAKKTQPKVGDKIFQGSSIETGTSGRAKIIMSDRSVIHISPSTKTNIANYVPNEGKKNVEIQLSQGKIRSEVKGAYGENNKFLIKTPTAVAGVRGTDFLVNHNIQTNTTSVTTFKGAVELTALKNGIPSGSPVIIQKDQQSSVSTNANVEPPKIVTDDEKNKLDNDTKSSESSAPSKNGKQDSSNNSGSTSSSDSAGGSDGKKRIGNAQDTAAENFEPSKTAPTTAAPVAPAVNKFIPPTNTRQNDAVRGKTDKTNVKIIPKK